MLGYRTFFTVDSPRQHVLDTTMSQLHSWLRHKGYAADRLENNTIVSLGEGVEGTLLELTGQDGSRSLRAQITEELETGRWTTALTAHVPGRHDRQPWVWIDIDAPIDTEAPYPERRRRWTGTPRLVRHLLDVFDASDGQAELAPKPQTIAEGQAERLLDIVCDPDRRGLVFLAGTDEEMPVPRWAELVDGLVAETVGISGAYVLTGDATAHFNELIGETHAVAPGTVRTYHPFADPADPFDALKHRVLTTGRILNDSGRNIRRLLGWKAREVAIETPLPASAARLDRQFERTVDKLLVAGLTSAGTPPAAAEAGALQAEITTLEPSATATVGAPVDELRNVLREEAPLPTEVDGYLALRTLLLEVTGFEELIPETVDELSRLARAGLVAESGRRKLDRRLQDLQTRNTELAESNDQLVEVVRDTYHDHFETLEELERTEDQLRALQQELARNGRAGDAWSETVLVTRVERPASFDELLDRVSGLDLVVFTGDPGAARELDHGDAHETWARKTWDALLALNDYAIASADGRCRVGVHGYLQTPPNGCHGFSATRHASNESEAVKNNPRLAKCRELPVPADVAPEGRVFMGAHLKIAQAAAVSPRLHYCDDTGHTGKIYVGYIGRHLPTTEQT